MAEMNSGLDTLAARLQEDLANLCYPPKNWVPRQDAGGEPVTDVAIIGGGMCGLLAWHALTTLGIRNTRILDRNREGFEGPWLTYARMETLRSPKQLPGPCLGHGSLTFQAWFRAKFGDQDWQKLDKIPRPMWMDYLRWYRHVLKIPVENSIEMTRVEPEENLLRLTLSGAPEKSLLARKLVLATGRDGTGHPNIPSFMTGTPKIFWAHTADDIDFNALMGRRVAVIGVGASAVDNAAEALEAGAAEVRHIVRRDKMPTVNKLMGIGSPGFLNGFASLPDEWRWRFIQYSFATQTPSPRGSTLRVSRHKNAFFHFGKSVARVAQKGDELSIEFADGTELVTDFLILGTGFATDQLARTEFGEAAGEILQWGDVYTPPLDEDNLDLSRFPYLNEDFTFREKTPGTVPWLGKIYCFNYGSTASLGKVSGDIPGVSEGASALAKAVTGKLYNEDISKHWQDLVDCTIPELLGDEWKPSDL